MKFAQKAGVVPTSPTLDVKPKGALEFPDDPLKWDGWSKYKAANVYERLCLDPHAKPDDEQIQQHCNALLQWWQKKLWLKNQPTNPIAQLLGRGIDEAGRYLVQARVLLLDPERRRQVDVDLAAQAEQEALAEFSKFVAFSIAGRVLTAEAEANLWEFAHNNGLTEDQTRTCIDDELRRQKAERAAPASTDATEPAGAIEGNPEAEKEYVRIMRLSDLDLSDATVHVRQIFGSIAENLGINLERGEYLLDAYLEEREYKHEKVTVPAAPETRVQTVTPPPPPVATSAPAAAPAVPGPAVVHPILRPPVPADLPRLFTNPVGAPMVLIPAGEFVMGSDAADAAPNEQPLTSVTLSDFYMARHPVTNAEYEQFDPSHKRKRLRGAGDDNPVVYVSSLDAVKYCEWLRQKDGKNYRLPTEAEWEYAARGSDGRKYPWGNHNRRADFANFADASTAFPWRDLQINDGYPETSPVGAFPRGASFFGIEDMAGNVWEWCLDFYQAYPGAPKRNPRGLAAGSKRIYRGGSWKSRFSSLRATARSGNSASFSCNDVGFRVICEGPGNDAS